LPITLSILYIQLGKSIGLDLQGVNMPGRYVVKHLDGKTEKYIDVFDGGKIYEADELPQLVLDVTGKFWKADSLEIATDKSTYLRVVQNLFGNAERKSDREAQLEYVNLMLAVDPQSVSNRGMRAVLRMETGRKKAAIADLNWIIEQEPEGIDLDRIYEMRAAFERSR